MTVNFTFWLILAISASVSANILMLWYIRRALSRVFVTGENLTNLVDLLASYSSHIESVHELEKFYGDEEIKGLVSHTNNIIDVIEQEYSDVLYITSIIEYEEEQEEQIDEKKEVVKENVFYAGTRESNT